MGFSIALSKYEAFRSGLPTVTERYPQLALGFAFLQEQQDTHFDLVHRLVGTTADRGSTPLFEVDIVLLSVLNRSLDLIDGFVSTYNRWNVSTAAPQVRMQVDNLLRLALVHVAPPHSVSRLLLSGDRLSDHADPLAPLGKKFKLTDARLSEHARPLFPWLDLVYERASGWVHFSSVHVGVTMLVGADGTLSGRFPIDIDHYPFDFLEQVLWAMNEATSGVVSLVDTFASGKEQASRNWE